VHLKRAKPIPGGSSATCPWGPLTAALTFANEGEEFVMTLGEKVFSAKERPHEEAARTLARAVLSRRDLQPRRLQPI